MTVFLVSTKFPTFAPSFSSVSGLILANGPILHLEPMLAPSMFEWEWIFVASPISLLAITV